MSFENELLAPELLDIIVIVLIIIIHWTVLSIVLEILLALLTLFIKDSETKLILIIFKRIPSANYCSVVIMTLSYFFLVMILEPIDTIYPNPYDWLLIGSRPIMGCIIFGVVSGIVMGWFLGKNNKLRIGMGIATVVCEAAIAALTSLWILSQP